MPKWVLEDDCLAPMRTLKINYSGPNPFRFYPPIRRIIGNLLEVRGKDIWERDFRWDFSSDPREFFVRIVIRKGTGDRWSNVFIELIFQGHQPSDPTKDGDMVIQISSKLRTEMSENTVWQRSPIYKGIRWLYFRTLYADARRVHLDYCISWTYKLRDALQKLLGITASKEV